jgi:hypothetical protein
MVALPTVFPTAVKLNSIPWQVLLAGKPSGQSTTVSSMYSDSSMTGVMTQEGIIEDSVGSDEGLEDGLEDGIEDSEGADDGEPIGGTVGAEEGTSDGLVEGIDDMVGSSEGGFVLVVGDEVGSADAKGVGFEEVDGIELRSQSKKSYSSLILPTVVALAQVFPPLSLYNIKTFRIPSFTTTLPSLLKSSGSTTISVNCSAQIGSSVVT